MVVMLNEIIFTQSLGIIRRIYFIFLSFKQFHDPYENIFLVTEILDLSH